MPVEMDHVAARFRIPDVGDLVGVGRSFRLLPVGEGDSNPPVGDSHGPGPVRTPVRLLDALSDSAPCRQCFPGSEVDHRGPAGAENEGFTSIRTEAKTLGAIDARINRPPLAQIAGRVVQGSVGEVMWIPADSLEPK